VQKDKIITAEFLSRVNRFVIECRIKGRKQLAYLPNPGRLYELLLPGRRLFLKALPGFSSLKFRTFGVVKDGINVLLDTHYTNQVAKELIEGNLIDDFRGYKIIKEEVQYNNSRFDFLLSRGSERIFLEVKSCTLFSNKLAMFPDAVSERAKRHILTLSQLSDERTRGAVLFVVNSPSAEYFLPEYHTDPEFSDALYSVRNKILIKAVRLRWKEDFSGLDYAGESAIPWDLYLKERGDKGAYILGLFLPEIRRILTRGTEFIKLKKGYYIYAGSALKNLSLFSFPVRTCDDIECEIAKGLMEIADATIEGFGSSDCSCRSHLFWFRGFPLTNSRFVKLLQYFRMDRVAEKYGL
jgi:sugar fermentation stimulation protein A